MSPVEHLPDEEALPPVDPGDLAATVRLFADAVQAGRVTQIATVHRWADELRRALDQAPAVPSETRPRQRWT